MLLFRGGLFVGFRRAFAARSEQETERDSAQQEPGDIGPGFWAGDLKRMFRGVNKVRQQQRRNQTAEHSGGYSEARRHGYHHCQANQRQYQFHAALIEDQCQKQSDGSADQGADGRVNRLEHSRGWHANPHIYIS